MFFGFGRPKPVPMPTLVHITHHKAGSCWVDRILRELFGDQVVQRIGTEWFKKKGADQPCAEPPPQKALTFADLFHQTPYREGAVYPSLYLTREEFEKRPEFANANRFVVIRDPRDTLVSLYFSARESHPLDVNGRVEKLRGELRAQTKEEGLAMLIESALNRVTAIQRTWTGGKEIVLRYEDLIVDDLAIFERLLLERFAIPVSRKRLRKAVEVSRFDKVFKRPLGEVDEKSHGRQGAAGDWKNHFTPELRRLFHDKYGDLLIALGYEKDGQWVAAGGCVGATV